VVATLEPVVAALGGVFLLHEPFGVTQWIGAALVLSGVFMVQAEGGGARTHSIRCATGP
jgi:drug/metabolite transporter (DMT)-like permease